MSAYIYIEGGVKGEDSKEVDTRECSNAYAKGTRSFEILGKLSPAVLAQHLPSFVRVRRILTTRL